MAGEINPENNTSEPAGSGNKVIIISLICAIVIIAVAIPVFFLLKTESQDTQLNQSQNQTPATGCTENWNCTEWTNCSNATQTRTCTDLNNCTTENSKPETTQACAQICEEKFLPERKCKNENEIQRMYQNNDCTTEWKTIHLCGELTCDSDQNSSTFAQCRLYTCDELNGEICSVDLNKTCEDNDFEKAFDSSDCCVSNCTDTNSTE